MNGGAVPAGRLPPQAPSSRPPGLSSSQGSGARQAKSKRSKGSRRARSASDGVRGMNASYQQQQQAYQQQYYGGYPPNGGGYPLQYPNQPPPGPGYGPPPGPPPPNGRSRSGRAGSFDAAAAPPFGMYPDGGPQNYGSMQPPPRPRSGSKEFNRLGEISSVIASPNNGSLRGTRSPGRRPYQHRRSLSDSFTPQRGGPPPNLPTVFQGNPLVMPNPDYRGPNRARGDSFGSQGSYHSQRSFQGPPMPGPSIVDPETEALMAQYAAGGAPGGHKCGRPKTHMRQHSVNLYMKTFKGEKQPRACRDVVWGFLFVLQLAVMCVVGLRFGPEALVATAEELGPGEGMDDDDAPIMEDIEDDAKIVLAYQNIVKMAYTCGAFAIIVSALALAFMMAMSRRLVYVALVLSIGVSFAWGTIGIGISPKSFVPITGIVALMLTVGYMFVVWDRIPFASANLTTALTGVRDHLGLVGVAFFFQFLALACSIYYSFAFVGLHDAMNNKEVPVSGHLEAAIDILLLVSYYWTFQVLRRIVMVTVAGTIGSWWFDRPSALKETFLVASVYNFGSVCYGALFVGFVQFLRQITEGMRPNNDDSAMMCLYECSVFFQEKIVGCVDSLADEFTPWAFTYVGLYQYGLKEAGHKANELFDRRGWSRIVTDDLISSVLAMVSLVIGGLTGSFAVILQALDGHGLSNFGHPVLTSFTIGFLVGIVLSIVLFSIIDSSVCAVIVCFAASPVEFHRNHPELSHEMRHAWKEVWPGSLDIDGVGLGNGMV